MQVLPNLLLLATISLLIQNASAFTVGNKMEGVLSAVKGGLKVVHRHLDLTGHEEITRQGINLAIETAQENNITFSPELTNLAFQNLKSEKFGLIGSEATNPLIQGNYATDFPFSRTDFIVDIPKYWGIQDAKKNMEWQNHPKTQVFHFLRNHLEKEDAKGSLLVGQRESCLASRDAIIRITKDVSALFRQKTTTLEERELNVRKGLFLVGHATHILQDSFSDAHGKRSERAQNFDLKEMCYFGFDRYHVKYPKTHKTRLNSCHHGLAEIISDGVWLTGIKGIKLVKDNWPAEPIINATPGGFSACVKNYTKRLEDNDACIKHTTRMARTATAKFLLVLTNYMKFDDETVAQKDHMKNYLIDNLFEGSLRIKGLDDAMSEGVMRCDGLPE